MGFWKTRLVTLVPPKPTRPRTHAYALARSFPPLTTPPPTPPSPYQGMEALSLLYQNQLDECIKRSDQEIKSLTNGHPGTGVGRFATPQGQLIEYDTERWAEIYNDVASNLYAMVIDLTKSDSYSRQTTHLWRVSEGTSDDKTMSREDAKEEAQRRDRVKVLEAQLLLQQLMHIRNSSIITGMLLLYSTLHRDFSGMSATGLDVDSSLGLGCSRGSCKTLTNQMAENFMKTVGERAEAATEESTAGGTRPRTLVFLLDNYVKAKGFLRHLMAGKNYKVVNTLTTALAAPHTNLLTALDKRKTCLSPALNVPRLKRSLEAVYDDVRLVNGAMPFLDGQGDDRRKFWFGCFDKELPLDEGAPTRVREWLMGILPQIEGHSSSRAEFKTKFLDRLKEVLGENVYQEVQCLFCFDT